MALVGIVYILAAILVLAVVIGIIVVVSEKKNKRS